jgi:3-dehydroquinate dehydratase type I
LTPKICVSILPYNLTDALKMLTKAELLGADFIEVRLDELDMDCDLNVLVANRKVPLIATDKAVRESIEHRFLALNAAKSGFPYVDLDLITPRLSELVREVKGSGAKCVISFHDVKGTPALPKLLETLQKQIQAGADVCKIATTATQMQDNLTLLQFTSEVSAQAKVVCFGMGDFGRTSRLLSPIFGGLFTFAALDVGGETAPGQMSLQEMRLAYELLRLN